MYCRHLSLLNFRNYRRLDLDLSPRLSLFWGDNGQGKSNLLEALYLLATTRSYRTTAERELVNWHADTNPVFGRVAADVVRHQATSRLEIILAEPPGVARAAGTGERPAAGSSGSAGSSASGGAVGSAGAGGAAESTGAAGAAGQPPAASIRRRARINGQPKPPLELLGHLNVVLFAPEDVELIAGPAEQRRRYLDITLCQVDHLYLLTARRYLRVLQQRNALLREARDRAVPSHQFEYWDAQLIELGAAMMVSRLRALLLLNEHLAEIYPRLASSEDGVRARYRASVPLDDSAAVAPVGEAATALVRDAFARQLDGVRVRERALGVTLMGPQRDDVSFHAGDVDLRVYGSRGQQRTAALALKLAEVALMQRYTGERPVLLLDDVMSELDPHRRRFLEAVIAEQEQVLLTTTDLEFFSREFLDRAERYRVAAGALRRDG